MEKLKDCLLTTYVAGEKYKAFIPLLLYSCKKAYPEYDVMLFLHDELNDEIWQILDKMNLLKNAIIKENSYNCKKGIKPLIAGSTRWILFDKQFFNYKYIYIIDIDIFYIRENKPLHIQHSERMEITKLPFDNLRRKVEIKLTPRSIAKRIVNCHCKGLYNFVTNKDRSLNRLTGLHFIDTYKYYNNNNIEIIHAVAERLYKDKFFFPEILMPNDESLLYLLTKLLGYNPDILGCQTNSTNMLDFNNNLRAEFRPHHGIHLGIFKNSYFHEMPPIIQNNVRPILESETYKYYIDKFKIINASDEFKYFVSLLPKDIKIYIDRMNAYYNIL